ncbi:MAG TPA: hypothetical protein VKB65_07285 [Myxococcota bacterium]|nr:hypothetical protein [Myxococcota bacterium]
MVWLGAIGGGAFVVAAVVIGWRLIWLSRRTRGLPEFAIGTGLFLMGGLGYPLIVLARQMTAWPDAARAGLILANEIFAIVGMTLVAVFNWRVFRPNAPWAKALVGAIAATLTGLMVAQGCAGGWLALADGANFPWAWAAVPNAVALGWAGLESLGYHRTMVKRARLGLADAALVDRFRLWAIGTFSSAFLTLASLSGQIRGIDMATSTEGALLVGAFGVVSAGAMWLAFLPPAAYTRWVARAREV